jgi:hypothetical protein
MRGEYQKLENDLMGYQKEFEQSKCSKKAQMVTYGRQTPV